jgi:Protein of unknown function (DUF1579)
MARSTAPRRSRLIMFVGCLAAISVGRVDAQGPPMPKPAPEHEVLKSEVGTWDAAMTVWPAPGAQPVTGQGTETNSMLQGDMWLISHFDSDFGGMPFAGRGAFGYDPMEKKYVGVWIDSMSPYMSTSQGDYDAATKTMTMIAKTCDAMTGKPVTQKQISHYVDGNTRTFEIQQQGDDGKFWKMFEVQYKRKSE